MRKNLNGMIGRKTKIWTGLTTVAVISAFTLLLTASLVFEVCLKGQLFSRGKVESNLYSCRIRIIEDAK